ncbi:hypothetical protein ACIRBX_33950 [Kitasatospora sp. NPDC096147]|uniref:hypothetical protein n=1 Tax=Kitasatospora sp. NPDC096147 TaxID=3364093 RepID=UPI003814159B
MSSVPGHNTDGAALKIRHADGAGSTGTGVAVAAVLRWVRVVVEAVVGLAVVAGVNELLVWVSYRWSWAGIWLAVTMGGLLILALFPLGRLVSDAAERKIASRCAFWVLVLACAGLLISRTALTEQQIMQERGRTSTAVVTRTWQDIGDRAARPVVDLRLEDGRERKHLPNDFRLVVGDQVSITLDPKGGAVPVLGGPYPPDPFPLRIVLCVAAAGALATSAAANGLRDQWSKERRRRRRTAARLQDSGPSLTEPAAVSRSRESAARRRAKAWHLTEQDSALPSARRTGPRTHPSRPHCLTAATASSRSATGTPPSSNSAAPTAAPSRPPRRTPPTPVVVPGPGPEQLAIAGKPLPQTRNPPAENPLGADTKLSKHL